MPLNIHTKSLNQRSHRRVTGWWRSHRPAWMRQVSRWEMVGVTHNMAANSLAVNFLPQSLSCGISSLEPYQRRNLEVSFSLIWLTCCKSTTVIAPTPPGCIYGYKNSPVEVKAEIDLGEKKILSVCAHLCAFVCLCWSVWACVDVDMCLCAYIDRVMAQEMHLERDISDAVLFYNHHLHSSSGPCMSGVGLYPFICEETAAERASIYNNYQN